MADHNTPLRSAPNRIRARWRISPQSRRVKHRARWFFQVVSLMSKRSGTQWSMEGCDDGTESLAGSTRGGGIADHECDEGLDRQSRDQRQFRREWIGPGGGNERGLGQS